MNNKNSKETGENKFLTSIREFLHDYQWFVLAFFWILSAFLGYVGFKKYFINLGETRLPSTIFYLTIQLFVLESGSIQGNLPWELETARILAPAVATYSAIRALIVIFHEQFQLFYGSFLKDHVIICGLGQKGTLLVQSFRQKGNDVVVIEKDEENTEISGARRLGVIVISGNAADNAILAKAKLQKAKYLITVCGDDGVNADIAAHAREMVKRNRENVLTCFVHIVDPDLCDFLTEQEMATRKADSFRLEIFNAYKSGAKAILNYYSPFNDKKDFPHLVAAGFGRMGQSLVIEAIRRWKQKYFKESEKNRLKITVIDRQAENGERKLRFRYKSIDNYCDLDIRQMDTDSPEFLDYLTTLNSTPDSLPGNIFICLGEDSVNLSTGLKFLRYIEHRPLKVITIMKSQGGLSELFHGEDYSSGRFGDLEAFSLWNEICRSDHILEGINEKIARAFHNVYRETRGVTGEGILPSEKLWKELDEVYKESNRLRADGLCSQLKKFDMEIVPLTDWNDEIFRFDNELDKLLIDELAKTEHERYCMERKSEGWKFGEVKDDHGKTNPNLVPYDKLQENVKEYNRSEVKKIPEILADAGFKIFRKINGEKK